MCKPRLTMYKKIYHPSFFLILFLSFSFFPLVSSARKCRSQKKASKMFTNRNFTQTRRKTCSRIQRSPINHIVGKLCKCRHHESFIFSLQFSGIGKTIMPENNVLSSVIIKLMAYYAVLQINMCGPWRWMK